MLNEICNFNIEDVPREILNNGVDNYRYKLQLLGIGGSKPQTAFTKELLGKAHIRITAKLNTKQLMLYGNICSIYYDSFYNLNFGAYTNCYSLPIMEVGKTCHYLDEEFKSKFIIWLSSYTESRNDKQVTTATINYKELYMKAVKFISINTPPSLLKIEDDQTVEDCIFQMINSIQL